MRRQARLDGPETLHHVMGHGLDRQVLFRDDLGPDDFVRRFAGLAETKAVTLHAWALLPNHTHLWPHHLRPRHLSPRRLSSPSVILHPVSLWLEEARLAASAGKGGMGAESPEAFAARFASASRRRHHLACRVA